MVGPEAGEGTAGLVNDHEAGVKFSVRSSAVASFFRQKLAEVKISNKRAPVLDATEAASGEVRLADRGTASIDGAPTDGPGSPRLKKGRTGSCQRHPKNDGSFYQRTSFNPGSLGGRVFKRSYNTVNVHISSLLSHH